MMTCCKCGSNDRVKSFQIMGMHYVSLCWLHSKELYLDRNTYLHHVSKYRNANITACGVSLGSMVYINYIPVSESVCCKECWATG